MRLIKIFLVGVFVVLPVFAQNNAGISEAVPEKDAFVQIVEGVFPEQIGEFVRGSVYDYEIDDPGYGFSVGYDSDVAAITIYIYDKGMTPIEFTADSASAEFDNAMAEIASLEEQGIYSGITVVDQKTSSIPLLEGPLPVLQGVLTFTMQYADEPVVSYLLLGAHNGKFLKIRATFPQSVQESQAKIDSFVSEFGKKIDTIMASLSTD